MTLKQIGRTVEGFLILAVLAFGFSSLLLTPSHADDHAVPVAVGDKVRLLYEGAGARACDVEEVVGTFVRCAQGKADGQWFNLQVTLGIDHRR